MATNSNCIFCKIADGKDEKTELLYDDENTVVFRDIRPASTHHYLIVPKEHIKDTKQLDQSHIKLVENLIQIGNKVLQEKKGDLEDTRYGFHWPPFIGISHVHLHVISPTKDMSFIARGIFRPNSFWFVTPDWLIDRLKKMGEKISS